MSLKTIQQWMEKGLLTGFRTSGGHRRIHADAVLRLAEKRRQEHAATAGTQVKVLVIEDDPDICRLYDIMSRSWRTPAMLHFAHDGMAGLIAIGELHPDFVVVDLNIPKVDGYQLIQTLSGQFDDQVPRYCVVTGLPPEEIARRGTLPAQCPVLGKPIDFSTLEQWIARSGAAKAGRNS